MQKFVYPKGTMGKPKQLVKKHFSKQIIQDKQLGRCTIRQPCKPKLHNVKNISDRKMGPFPDKVHSVQMQIDTQL